MPAGPTYEPIATANLSGQFTVNFSNIPQTYTDLTLVIAGSMSSSAFMFARMNGVSTSGAYAYIYGYNTTAAGFSARTTSDNGWYTNRGFGDTSASYVLDIIRYTSNKAKMIYYRQHCTANDIDEIGSGVYLNDTNPITSLSVTLNLNSWSSNTTATLFGIAAA